MEKLIAPHMKTVVYSTRPVTELYQNYVAEPLRIRNKRTILALLEIKL
jgi:hypothetical protein